MSRNNRKPMVNYGVWLLALLRFATCWTQQLSRFSSKESSRTKWHKSTTICSSRQTYNSNTSPSSCSEPSYLSWSCPRVVHRRRSNNSLRTISKGERKIQSEEF